MVYKNGTYFKPRPDTQQPRLCMYGCNFVAAGLKELEAHVVHKHGVSPARPKHSKHEQERRDLANAMKWLRGEEE